MDCPHCSAPPLIRIGGYSQLPSAGILKRDLFRLA
jgi:hypothetical protein